MIARLREALRAAGYEPSPEEIADIVWLATRDLGHPPCLAAPGPTDEVPGAAPEVTPARTGAGAENVGGPTDLLSEQAGQHTLYASVHGAAAVGRAVTHTRIATPRALTNARGLARSLRPLRSTVRSRTRYELDIPATIETIADGLSDIVVRPVREPLLDLTLVVDDGVSMAVWHDVARELYQSLYRLKAFRRTRLLGMNTDDPRLLRFTAEPFRPGTPRPTPPTTNERSLLLVLSDGVGHAWQTGEAQSALNRWAQQGPTAVLHVLSPDMWQGTGLPVLRLMATSPRPAASNGHFQLRHPRLPHGILPVPQPPVPVIDLVTGMSVAAWARLVGSPTGQVALHFYDQGQFPSGGGNEPDPGAAPPSPEESLDEFLGFASEEARRLAAHLACAGSALTVPLMRLVQRSAVPDSGPQHLAEVFLAGLLTPSAPMTWRVDAESSSSPLPHERLPWDRRSYAFPASVAGPLRELIRRSDEQTTYEYVTRYLAREREAAGAGMALITDPTGVIHAGPDTPTLGTVEGTTRVAAQPRQEASLEELANRVPALADPIGGPTYDWLPAALADPSRRFDHARVRRYLAEAADAEADATAGLTSLALLARELGRNDIADAYEARSRAPRRGRVPYFFLSYARTPRSSTSEQNPDFATVRLYRDLCEEISRLTEVDPAGVGFIDQRLSSGEVWSDEVSAALASCQVFVPLYSPRYFRLESCGKEWYAFAQRVGRYEMTNRGTTKAIVPVLWIPVPHAEIPEVARSLQYDGEEFEEEYRAQGLYGLIKMSRFREQYKHTVFRLARHIVDAAESIDMPPADPLPYETISSAFDPGRAREIQLTPADRHILLRNVALIYRNQSSAHQLLEAIGFPSTQLPAFGAPIDFWNEVFLQMQQGVMPAPFRLLLEAIHRTYGYNHTIIDLSERYGLVDPEPEPEPAAAAPVAAPVTNEPPTCHVIIRAENDDEREAARRVLTELGQDPREVWSTQHAVSYRLTSTNPRNLRRQLERTSLGWTVVAPGGPDYLLHTLYVEGPDGRQFRITDAPAAQTVGNVAAEVVDQYGPAMDTSRPTVIDHVGPDGHHVRLDPEATLTEESVHEGGRLRVLFEGVAGEPRPHFPEPSDDS
ncbi:TIR-like protein FxsC [Streptomyces mirabilis]